MLKPDKQKTQIDRKTKIEFIVVCFILLGAIPLAVWLYSSFFETNDLTLTETSSWEVRTSSSSAEILWQKLVTYSNVTHLVSTSPDSTVFASQNRFIALDNKSGERIWEFQISNPNGLRSLENGYLVGGLTSGQTIVTIDTRGEEVWRTEQSGLKLTPANLYLTNNRILLYKPPATNPKIFVFSLETGNQLQVIEDHALFAASDDLIVYSHQATNSLDFVDAESEQTRWSLDLTERDFRNSYFVGQSDDIVLIGFGGYRVDAYDVHNGKLLWSLTYNGLSPALLKDDKLISFVEGDKLELYDINSGTLDGEIHFSRMPTNHIDRGINLPVQLAASGNLVIISDYRTGELIALRIGLIGDS